MKKSASTNLGDYMLDTSACDAYTNAELTITLRIGFRQINPQGATGTYNDYGDPSKKARRIVPWTPSTWTTWVRNFVRASNSFWNGRLWLMNNFPDLDVQVGSTKYRPNVDCKLSLHGEQVAQFGYHYVIDVVKLDPSEQSFGSTSALYDSNDLRPVPKGVDKNGRPIMQLGGVHEIGHLLGLEHVDFGKPHCPVSGDTNAPVCYGIDDKDKNSLMGAGIALRHEHANPWRRAMIQLTGKGNLATMSDWAASKLRIYPRTMAEAAANKTITARPVR